jgi:hypothetical protein
MKRGQYLILGTLILFSCGVKKPQRISDKENYSDSIVTEAWLDFDMEKQSSFVDIHKFGRMRIPGKWYHSTLSGNTKLHGRHVYENKDYDILIVDIDALDTISFYKKGMTDKEFVNKSYEQYLSFLKGKELGKIETIEENKDNVIGRLTVDSTKQMFFLFGLKNNYSMNLCLIPTKPDDKEEIDLIRKVFNE